LPFGNLYCDLILAEEWHNLGLQPLLVFLGVIRAIGVERVTTCLRILSRKKKASELGNLGIYSKDRADEKRVVRGGILWLVVVMVVQSVVRLEEEEVMLA
jgi:hypothetical protein